MRGGNSESNKRSARTKLKKYGSDYHKKIASRAGKASTRGYFGVLKDTDPELLSKISKDAARKKAAKHGISKQV